jgi:hypothetical protein
MINTAFAQDMRESATAQGRVVADQLREKFPKLAALMDDAERDASVCGLAAVCQLLPAVLQTG